MPGITIERPKITRAMYQALKRHIMRDRERKKQGITIERPKITRAMYQALKRHIMRDRERKKQEQEHDKAMERERKERELKKKKEEEDSLTLEQTREQIGQLEDRLEALKGEKHELFSQLKKVLHQEDESRKRAQLKEHNEMLSLQQYNTTVTAHPMYLQTQVPPRNTKFLTVPVAHQSIVAGMKRTRSPSPPPASSIYSHYPGSKHPVSSAYVGQMKSDGYPSIAKSNFPSTHVTYANQPGLAYQPPHVQQHQGPPMHQMQLSQHHTVPIQHQAPPPPRKQAPPQTATPPQQHKTPPTQQHQNMPKPMVAPAQHQQPNPQSQTLPSQHQPALQQHQLPPHSHQGPPPHQSGAPPTQHTTSQSQIGKYPPGQSAFQTYSNHYIQKQMTERLPQGYPVQRVPQPGYMESARGPTSFSLQQQLEHANQKSGFSEEKFKIQQAIHGMSPISQQQAQMLATAQLPASQASNQQPPKGSIVTGYPIRTQANTNYQPPASQGTHSPHATGPRHPFRGAQPPGRFY
ncbi:hypothetical protein LSH36_298g02005 [Paralvinella palmiformis]|uniref:G protein pathway suppressor 2 n=1 Tax=Paralvinella palmiformis TaxID=53620 RepID=A0AAD9JIZ6_9ANNE|nr:hypothetical protein LSH36_298g02005 [Paralvinella palmiformis]